MGFEGAILPKAFIDILSKVIGGVASPPSTLRRSFKLGSFQKMLMGDK